MRPEAAAGLACQ